MRGRREAFLEETLDWNRARTWPLLLIRVLLQCNIRITYQCVNDYWVRYGRCWGRLAEKTHECVKKA